MQTTYPFRNLAVNNLLDFQEKEFVFDFFNYFQSKTQLTSNKLMDEEYYKGRINQKLDWYDNALQSLEKEINQVMHTAHQLGINQYFEELKKYRHWICELAEEKLKYKLNNWNIENNNAFEKKVEEDTEVYFQSENRKMKHLQEYEAQDFSFLGLILSPNPTNSNATKQLINYNYYCTDEIPYVIDLDYLPNYLSFLEKVSNKFASVVDKYIEMYDKGKIVCSSTITVNHVDVIQSVNTITTADSQKQLPEAKKSKIKWNGTPREFVELFAPMITSRKLYLNKKNQPDTDPIVKLLFDTFEITKDKGSGEISENSLCTYFKEYNSTRSI